MILDVCSRHNSLIPGRSPAAKGKRPLFEVGLPITSLHRAAATCQRLVQALDDRGLEALILGRLDDVLVAERMVHVRGQPTGECHREFRRRIVDLDSQIEARFQHVDIDGIGADDVRPTESMSGTFSFFNRGASFSSICKVRFGAGISSRTMRPNQSAIGSPSGGAPRCSSFHRYSRTPHSSSKLKPRPQLAVAVVSRFGPGMPQERHRERRIASHNPLAVAAARLPKLVRRPTHRGRFNDLFQPFLEFHDRRRAPLPWPAS